MDSLILVLNIIFIVISAFALMSYFGSYNESRKITSKLIREMTSTKQVEKEYTDQEEIDALNVEYSLNITEPVQTKTFIGPINVNKLSVSNGASSSFVTIKGVQINVPSYIPVSTFLDSDRLAEITLGSSKAKLALVGKKFYLLSLGGFVLTQQIRSEKIEKDVQMAISEGHRGKIETVPLEIMTERDGTDYENAYFDSIKAGIPYAILMMLSFTFAPFLMGKDATPIVWLSVYISILVCGFTLWFKSLKRLRRTVRITKMNGQFDEIVTQGNRKFVQVYDETNSDGKLAFRLPTVWDESFNISLHKKTTFEVVTGTTDIVSIERYQPFKKMRNIQPEHRYFGWMIATLLVFSFNTLAYIDVYQAKLALNMFITSPEVKKNNEISDWESVHQVGQRIQSDEFYKKCLLYKPSATAYDSRISFCDEFNVLEVLPEMNLMNSANKELKVLEEIDGIVDFPIIDRSEYIALNNKVNSINLIFPSYQKQQLISRNNLLQYNYYSLHNWALWLDKNKLDNESLRALLISLWTEDRTMKCGDNCWISMLSYDEGSSNDEYDLLGTRDTLKPLNEVKNRYLSEKAKAILSYWESTFFTDKKKDEKGIRVRLIAMNSLNEYWNDANDEIQKSNINSGQEYIEIFSKLSLSLETESARKGHIDYGVVSAIEFDGKDRVLVIDTTMNSYLYQMNLVKILLILLGGFSLFLLLRFRVGYLNKK